MSTGKTERSEKDRDDCPRQAYGPLLARGLGVNAT